MAEAKNDFVGFTARFARATIFRFLRLWLLYLSNFSAKVYWRQRMMYLALLAVAIVHGWIAYHIIEFGGKE
jgi:hypothetical protein